MHDEDEIIDRFTSNLIRVLAPKGGVHITVTERPADYPEDYVARIWSGAQELPLVAIAPTLEELLRAKPPEMIRLQIGSSYPVIETWI